ncbi:lipopolysaccharide biosynthesis protein [Treponema brennaborense]|uniref:Polysaccharide biosynthesis protein n=1 Tax=Treponema brennaborense (strain DSM 12168 / CIP 105900 / DD5/3) TaxID=906968 RepID=F4LQ02_TREBD|nr:oligosaccharide flippase family protein [Treponema brennaborense]AEE17080.1 polysaccharide biosynthesis protein [Treponema brennaborense DSM 12168]
MTSFRTEGGTASSTSRIARNTLFLYFRQILIMLVSLYTVRVVLDVLGAEDYGIYNVVAGVVTMFGFLSGAMATASQRYFSFDLGKGDTEHLKTTFSVTLQIYVLIALAVIVLAETAGLWFMNNKLVIPSERLAAANWIFQASIVSFLLTLITTPYMASIIAHENMSVYAYASIAEAALKLGIVFLLKFLPFDKLSLYGVLLAAVAFINTGIYRFYCLRHYDECRVRFVRDGALFREIVGYSGWNLFGSMVGVFKNQITNILLNLFFTPVVNAARAIASQVNSAVASFSQNFSTAVRPQIIKSYASNKKNECNSLVFYGCKITFFLMYIFSLPLVLEMDFVLKIWLKNPPELAVVFTQLALIDALIDSISYSIMTLAQATGKIKLYQGVVGGILLLNLPVSYIALKTGCPAVSVMVVSICITFAAFVVRLLIVKRLTAFSLRAFGASVVVPVVSVALLSAVVPVVLKMLVSNPVVEFLAVVLSAVASSGIFVLLVGMGRDERKNLLLKVKGRFRRVS